MWPVGIDTRRWKPNRRSAPTTDVLIYNKIHWNRSRLEPELLDVVSAHLRDRCLTVETIRYRGHRPSEYAAALRRCRTMVFLCEHETQGLACQEALAAGVPVLAWDPGEWLDPIRDELGVGTTPATSVPYFDERCGPRFRAVDEFPEALGDFLDRPRSGVYAPRDSILEHLTLDRCARRDVALLAEAGELAAGVAR